MKYCKNCGKEISENSSVCTNCGQFLNNQNNNGGAKKKKKWIIPLVIVLSIFFIIGVFSGDSNENNNTNEDSNVTNVGSNNNSSQTQENIEYIKVTKDELDEALENNAAAAKDTYKNKYVEISGKLGTIDSDLKYISLVSSTNSWDFIGIHCTIKTNEQKEIVKTLSKEQEITVKGKITDVGEVLGYYLDITEIVVY